MMVAQRLIGLILIGYVVGSIPFGLLVGLAKGVDPRKAGSGNIGATNVGRLLGGRCFAIVFILDLLKALLPMLAAGWIVHHFGGSGSPTWQVYLLWLLVGFATILGHMFSVFLGFKGGKGVASSAGMMLGLYPFYTFPGTIAIGVWVMVFGISRYVSLASIIAAAVFPLAYGGLGLCMGWPITGAQLPLLAFSVVMAGLVTVKHRTNIARLLAGTEHGFKKSKPEPR